MSFVVYQAYCSNMGEKRSAYRVLVKETGRREASMKT
jgi:hypothetical protein